MHLFRKELKKIIKRIETVHISHIHTVKKEMIKQVE
jgi:hypothetical protein